MIKFLVMDVDGTLTDGKLYFGPEGEVLKAFNIKDGYGIAHILRPAGIEPVIITGRSSKIVEKRCQDLKIEKVFQGKMDKLPVLKEIAGDFGLESCAYIGDDVPDLVCMEAVKKAGGLIGCPNDAIDKIKEISDYVCEMKAGDGAVREFIEWLVKVNK